MNPLAHTTRLPRAAPARVLACGAYLKNRACLVQGDQAHWSPLHGDLGDPESRLALAGSLDALLARADGPLDALAHDLHPDFHSTQLAQELAQRLSIPAIAVQHHHAHIGVVLAETSIDQPLLGVALDGFGLGSDGAAWGGELLWVNGSEEAQQWRRLDHLPLLTQPGGDAAAREPWRLACAVLFAVGRGHEIEARFAPRVGASTARLLQSMLARQVNCPPSSSAGRWFDAAAGALGVSVRQSFEAEAAIRLEQLATHWLSQHPEFEFEESSLDLHTLVAGLFALGDLGVDALGQGAAQFHLALTAGLAQTTLQAAMHQACKHVVLTGGCFANQLLRRHLGTRLQKAGLTVVEPLTAGCGDEGLALGQAWVATCAVANRATPHDASVVITPIAT